MKRIFTLAFAAAAVLSCAKDVTPAQVELTKGVVATAEDFQGATKTTISNTLAFAWAAGDVIGVVPMDDKTFQTNYEILSVGVDPKTASFDGGAWALKEGKSYAAYYPCQSIVLTSSGDAEVSFLGQTQADNDSPAHLGAYDFMYANAVSPVAGSTTFAFKHLVSLVKLTVPVQTTGVYKSITLKADSDVFAQKATLALSDGSLTAGTKSSSVVLGLDNLALASGESLSAWIAVMPTTDVDGCKFSATLLTSDNVPTDFVISTTVEAFEAGKAYALAGAVNSNVIFSDNFGWLSPVIEGFNNGKTADKVCADFVNGTYADLTARLNAGNNYSPNLYSTVGAEAFTTLLGDNGYTDLNPTAKVLYAQGTVSDPYLKMCKGNTQTALSFQPFSQAYATVELSLDWAIHMTASALDAVNLQFKIDGDGTFANGTQLSDPIASDQTAVGDPFWTNTKVTISGVTAGTKIIIGSKQAFDGSYVTSGQHRMYLDNIRIEKK